MPSRLGYHGLELGEICDHPVGKKPAANVIQVIQVAVQEGVALIHAAKVSVAEVLCSIEELDSRHFGNSGSKHRIVQRVCRLKYLPSLTASRQWEDRGCTVLAEHRIEGESRNIVCYKDSLA